MHLLHWQVDSLPLGNRGALNTYKTTYKSAELLITIVTWTDLSYFMHLVVTLREISLLTVCFISVIMKFKLQCMHLEGASDAELKSV